MPPIKNINPKIRHKPVIMLAETTFPAERFCLSKQIVTNDAMDKAIDIAKTYGKIPNAFSIITGSVSPKFRMLEINSG